MANIDLSQLITAEQKQAQATATLRATFEKATQAHLDAAAQEHGYDNLMTAISYADEPAVARFQADGKAFRAWRSLVWEYAYEQLSAVEAGTREVPTLEAFLAELPVLEVPA
ncbi:hypothetical protein [Pseudomonas typographi]|nr:hypothetical protein [Pseudomonas typographi]MBD1552317.1 hypothetical protein [Pseudomonas typographi]MBD1589276.1 hypothetical protein [Pseudomonas typographi]MBD1590267.1 hypothetical protein [Pseudomonas typographi]